MRHLVELLQMISGKKIVWIDLDRIHVFLLCLVLNPEKTFAFKPQGLSYNPCYLKIHFQIPAFPATNGFSLCICCVYST